MKMSSRKLKISLTEQKAMIDYLEWLQRARKNNTINQALLSYYEDEQEHFYSVVVDGEKITLPIFAKDEWLGVYGSLNDYVNEIKHTKRTDHHHTTIVGVAQEMYMRRLENEYWDEPLFFDLESILWNGGSSMICDFDEETVSVTIEETDFYSYVSKQERLLREFHSGLQNNDIVNPQDIEVDEIKKYTQRRNEYASDLDSLMEWDNHIHKSSPVCLLAVEQEYGGPIVYFIKRSNDVLHEPNAISTIPAGEVDPDAYSSIDFQQSIIREFVEELLGVPDIHYGSEHKNSETERRLRGHVSTESIEIERTSFGLLVDSPRPCFSGLVYVDDPEVGQWIRHQLQTNWEVSSLRRVELPLDGIPEPMKNDVVSTPGLFTFLEGLRRLEEKGVEIGLDIEVDH